MKATCWMGRNSVEVEDVPEPKILNDRDAIVRVTSTAICGSDLHLYDGYVPTMKRGDILGHEFMGEVVETGKDLATELSDDLRRFKQLVETGQIVRSDAVPRGHLLGAQLKQQPAQPVAEPAR